MYDPDISLIRAIEVYSANSYYRMYVGQEGNDDVENKVVPENKNSSNIAGERGEVGESSCGGDSKSTLKVSYTLKSIFYCWHDSLMIAGWPDTSGLFLDVRGERRGASVRAYIRV